MGESTVSQPGDALSGDLDRESARAESTPGVEQSISFVLQLYVAGGAPNSITALANVQSVCQEHLSGRYELEVIDVYQQPELARKAQLVAVPTLIRRSPAPLRRITGDLSSIEQLLVGLQRSPLDPVEGAL